MDDIRYSLSRSASAHVDEPLASALRAVMNRCRAIEIPRLEPL